MNSVHPLPEKWSRNKGTWTLGGGGSNISLAPEAPCPREKKGVELIQPSKGGCF